MNITELQQHEVAKIIPPMSDEDFDALKKSIETKGYDNRSPIVLFEGKVLDGWSRTLACIELKVVPSMRSFCDVPVSALEFVKQANVDRRHLTTSQRAAIGAEFVARSSDNGEGAKLPRTGMTVDQAAKAMKVSPRSIKTASAIRKSDPELAEKVKTGDLSLNQAKAASDKKNAAHEAAAKPIEVVAKNRNGNRSESTKTPLQWLTHWWMLASDEEHKLFDNFRAGFGGGR